MGEERTDSGRSQPGELTALLMTGLEVSAATRTFGMLLSQL